MKEEEKKKDRGGAARIRFGVLRYTVSLMAGSFDSERWVDLEMYR